MTNSSDQNQGESQQKPVVIRQGGNGFGLIIAALIIAWTVIYSINVWSTTRKETAPGVKLQEGVEKLRDAAQKKLDTPQQ